MTITDSTRYINGDRDPAARKARATYEAVRLNNLRRLGPLLIDSAPLQAALATAHAGGISYSEIAPLAGVSANHLRCLAAGDYALTQRRKATRVANVLRAIAVERMDSLQDCLDHLAVLEGRDCSERRWATADLFAYLERNELSVKGLLAEPDRRYLYRYPMLDTGRADRMALALGAMPEEIWEDWA